MSYYGNPIIDLYSRNSEKSERRLKDILNQDSGFICRSVVPDKGCDFDAELILEGTGASSWQFAIQLKSIEKLSIINNGSFISYSFATSRLGYLMRRIPAFGIIVLYSLDEDRCFYEFVDKICAQLTAEREDDGWKDQDYVNIHIPYQNILDDQAARHIHQTIRFRFEWATKMQRSHGHKYGLPLADASGRFQYDFNNVDHLKKFLSENGTLMLNNYQVGDLYSIIRKIPHADVYRSKELLTLAAFSFGEVGLHGDSNLFVLKLQKYDLFEEEKLYLRHLKLKNDLALGYIDETAFLTGIRQLNQMDMTEQNKITLAINIAHYQLIEKKPANEWAPTLESDILAIFDQLDRIEISNRLKGLLTLWNCNNLSYYMTGLETAMLAGNLTRYYLSKSKFDEAVARTRATLKRLKLKFDMRLGETRQLARDAGDDLLKAHSLSTEVRDFIHHHVTYFSFHIPVNTMPGFVGVINQKIDFSILAYDLFINQADLKEAYDSLCNTIELIELIEGGYGLSFRAPKKELYEKKKMLEADLDIHPREIVFLELIASIKGNRGGVSDFKNHSDEHIEMLAKVQLKLLNLPEERLVNIVNEFKSIRLFSRRCSNPAVTISRLLTDRERENPYLEPVKFILHDLNSSVQTTPNSNMEALLNAWNL